MIQKTAITRNIRYVAVCAALLAWAGIAVAAETPPGEYKPNEFLSLDLPKAVLSPKRLGPAAQFAPVAIEDASGDVAPQASAGPDARKPVQAARIRSAKVAARIEKPRGAARVKLAKRHGNPLDAQAFDTRVQVWPCKTGGICNWQRQ